MGGACRDVLTWNVGLRHSCRMRYVLAFTAICSIVTCPLAAQGATSAPAFYGDPPDQHHPWSVHDGNRPQPPVVRPGTFSSQAEPGQPPSDAIVLFDGKDLSQWENDKGDGPARWQVKDGAMEVAPKTGGIRTKQQFGDCQLHIEWAEPKNVEGTSQHRGNSGIFLMGICEIQVLDSYHNITYADGHAASVYGVSPPMANALRPPGDFQVYDIVFRRPIYRGKELVDPGYVTVFVNGVLAQDHAGLEGPTGHKKRTHRQPFPDKGPLSLQDHGNPVKFRNVWYRPLPPRVVEGGTDGWLTPEATMAKRKAIAADIRKDADQLADPANPLPQMLRLLESLVYAPDAAALQTATRLAETFLQGVKQLPADRLAAKKEDVLQLKNALDYLAAAQALPAGFAPKAEVDALVEAQKWDKK